MSYPTTKYISLDIYNNSIVCINAKQYDSNSRYVDVACTEHGKKIILDNTEVRAFVECTKPDGHYVFNEATVLENGSVLVELTQQMLAVEGRCKLDIILVDANGEIDVNATNKFVLLNSSVLSTMYFYINVLSSSVDDQEIVSSDEYNALTHTMARMVALDKVTQMNENERQDNEAIRIEAENNRISNEDTRQENESNRSINENTRKSNEQTRQNQESTREKNEETRQSNESDRENAESIRQSNEQTRQSQETSRVNEENIRNDNEETRKTNESTRQSQETERQNNEADRKTNEQARKTAESNRETAELQRVDAENQRKESEEERNSNEEQRKNAENIRISNEDARQLNETSRVTAENVRVTAENNRVSAETSRANAESVRIEAENSRVAEETNRVSAESARATAENARVSAEGLRQTNTAKAISECETATEAANTATASANVATDRANAAAEACEGIIDESGIVMKTEKGEANGVATLDENEKVPVTQLNIDIIYPVGSIYMSVNNVDPSSFFGGTWEQIKDTFLLAAGDTYEAGSTGGEAEHQLTIAEMPLHSHGVKLAYGSNDPMEGINYGNTLTGVAHDYGLIADTGGDQPHNNMPPYLTVYMWQRTA